MGGMRDFLIIWAALMAAVAYGYWLRGRVDAAKAERERRALAALYAHPLNPEFKAWLLDFIAVNGPRP